LAFYQRGGFRVEAVKVRTLIGRTQRDKSDYPAAIKTFEAQLQSAEQVKDQSLTALAHDGIGGVLSQQERYPEALKEFELSLTINQALKNQLYIGYNLLGCADLYWQLGLYEEARNALIQVFKMADHPGGNKGMLAEAYLSQAEMALSLRSFLEAKTKSQHVLALADPNDLKLIIKAKRALGLAQAFSGAKPEGIKICEEAVTSASSVNNPRMLALARLAFAEVLLESGNLQRAAANALQAQPLFAQAGQRDSEWRAWLTAARSSRAAGDKAKANEYALRATKLLS